MLSYVQTEIQYNGEKGRKIKRADEIFTKEQRDVYKRQVFSSVAISSDKVGVKMTANKTNKNGFLSKMVNIIN